MTSQIDSDEGYASPPQIVNLRKNRMKTFDPGVFPRDRSEAGKGLMRSSVGLSDCGKHCARATISTLLYISEHYKVAMVCFPT